MHTLPYSRWFVFLLATLATIAARAAEPTVDDLLRQAGEAHMAGKLDEAARLATRAIELDANVPRAYFIRGFIYESQRQHEPAIADYTTGLKMDPTAVGVYDRRGGEHFKLGHFAESIADFDKFIQLDPEQEPRHWKRGIAYYYAGRYAEGRKQFEHYQSVDDNDVENVVFRFLCMAKGEGVEAARQALLPVKNDARVPMMPIHALYAGKLQPDDVIAAAKAGNPSPEKLNEQLFYGHLYTGLYLDATGDAAGARRHLAAADAHEVSHYMWDVAHMHVGLLRRK